MEKHAYKKAKHRFPIMNLSQRQFVEWKHTDSLVKKMIKHSSQ